MSHVILIWELGQFMKILFKKNCNFWSKAEPEKNLCGDLQMSAQDVSE